MFNLRKNKKLLEERVKQLEAVQMVKHNQKMNSISYVNQRTDDIEPV